nr:ABC transporter substrate-binding protein [Salsipaludibacter albus]
MSPTATESLFAIGAGDQVVAVDEFSYYPEEAPVTDLSGYEPNAEAVADYEPDLVVLSAPGDIVGELDALGIPTVVETAATNFDDVYTQIENLGALTGHHDAAVDLTEQMEADLDELASSAPVPAEPLHYYHEISSDFYTASSASFVGQVYGLFGLVNIADDAAEQADTDYPQLSPEVIIEADPELIYLATGGAGESTESVADRPGWADLTAVTEGNVVVLPADIPSRWGPRVVDFAQVVADSLEPFAQ